MKKVILIKLGELWLKGKNRSDFINRLILNIGRITEVENKEIKAREGRIYIERKLLNDKQLADLKYAFGTTGYAEAYKSGVSMSAMDKISYEIAKEEVKKGAKTFKISARRSNKNFEKNSMEINTEIGERILGKFKKLSVDIHKPDFILEIEVRKDGVYAYSSTNEVVGSGGLPVGISATGLLMLSGGIDSPVAGWMMMKRGMLTDAVYFHTPPYTGEKTKEKIIDICKILSLWKTEPIKLFIPNFTEIQVEISKNIPDPFSTLLSRRFMVEIAQKLAQKYEYKALITGENLGQVASQTIENISAVSHGIEMPILRPVLGFDKQEIINIANKINTYKISILPYDDCCAVFASKNPKTKVKPESLVELKGNLNYKKLIENALEKTETYMVSFDKVEKIE